MNTKHTPGPWRKAGYSIVKGSGHRHVIADTYMQSNIKITEANARLIAAAPELLSACKDVMAMIRDGQLVRDIAKDASPTWAMEMACFVQRLNTVQLAVTKAQGSL